MCSSVFLIPISGPHFSIPRVESLATSPGEYKSKRAYASKLCVTLQKPLCHSSNPTAKLPHDCGLAFPAQLLHATRLSLQCLQQALDIHSNCLPYLLSTLIFFLPSVLHISFSHKSAHRCKLHSQDVLHIHNYIPISLHQHRCRANPQCDRQQHSHRYIQGPHQLEILTRWTKHDGYHLELCICFTRLHVQMSTFEHLEL